MRETGKEPLEAVKDPLYRLTRTDRTNPGATPPNQWTWNYDAVGNRTSAQKDSEATTSSYNEKNQLTGATGGGKMLWRGTLDEPGIATFSAPTINGQPARMLAGNVFEATLDLPAGANNVTIQAQDGSGNIATKVYSVNVIGVPSTHTYDANGNLAAKTEGADSWSYSWNALNELIAVTKNAVSVATYQYDPQGRRVERIADSTTGWVYDGEDIIRQNVTASAVTVASRFVHGPGIDEPLAQEEATAGTWMYLHADGLGSITNHTASSGGIVQSISYDAWGNVQSGSPGTYGFTSREWDAPAEMYYYRARWYDPVQGRFISQDPIGLEGGLNLYMAMDGNPATLVDPTGEVAAAPVVVRSFAAAAAACRRVKACREAVEKAVDACKDIRCEFKRSPADHYFPGRGFCEHFMLVCWNTKTKVRVFHKQWPLPGRCWPKNPVTGQPPPRPRQPRTTNGDAEEPPDLL